MATHQLVFALLKVLDDLPDELGEVAALDEIVRLDEDLAKTTLANGVVLEVEPGTVRGSKGMEERERESGKIE